MMIKQFFKIIWRQKLKNSFFMFQMILVFWVVFAVFTFGISKYRLASTPLGFEWEDNCRVSLDLRNYKDSSALESVLQTVKRNLLDMHEVDKVSYSTFVAPFLGNMWSRSLDYNGKTFYSTFIMTDEDYDEVWNIELKEGHYFNLEDKLSRNVPIVINQKLADEYLDGGSPIGKTLDSENLTFEVVGVTEHFKYAGEFSEEEVLMLQPIKDLSYYQLLIVKLNKGTGPETEQKISQVLENTFKSSEFEIFSIKNDRTQRNYSTYIPLGIMLFLALFLLINITMGLFGILRYNIAGRTEEIGLRKALGARASAIRKQFTGEMMVLTFLAFLVAFLFAIQLPVLTQLPVPNQDFYWGIAAGTILIFTIVYLCTLWPASQAAKLLPAEALHED